jgi:ribonuclease HI
VLQKLERVYHRALRWATGLPINTKLTRLHILARLPPLRLHLDYLSRRYAIRLLFAGPQHPLHKYFPLSDLKITNSWIDNTKRRDKPTTQYPTLFYPLSLLHCFLSAEDTLENRFSAGMSAPFSFTTLLPDEGKSPAQQHAEYLSRLPAHTLLLYTDGSKLDDGRCASAWLFTTPALNTTQDTLTGSCYLGKKCEVYDAELHAISEALPLLLSAPPSTVLLCVDNQSALTALQEGNPDNHEYARTALNHLFTLQQSGWTITGLWTPSHCGIPGNERVDQLAKNATQFHTTCPQARVTKC